jgi:hypothetical protein
MAGITIEIAEARLQHWLDIETRMNHVKVSQGSDQQRLEHFDPEQVQKQIVFWSDRVARLSRTGLRTMQVIPT